MTTETAEPGQGVIVPFLRAIEGGRNIEGNDVCARFADATQKLSIETSPMAGFAVFVWDDEGHMQTELHIGPRTPFSPMLVPKYASELFHADLMQQGAQ